MHRYYRNNYGRKTVKPFRQEDINNMLVLCKKRRNKLQEEENINQAKLWDRNYMMLVVGINLAFRVSDFLSLQVDNFKNGYLYTRERKTGKEQSFELNPSFYKDIDSYIKRNNKVSGEYLFPSRQGVNKPITTTRAYQIITELAKEVKINYPIGTHSLRKYFARQYYEQTGDLIGLKEMLNHTNENVTLRYICWDNDIKEKRRKSFYLGS